MGLFSYTLKLLGIVRTRTNINADTSLKFFKVQSLNHAKMPIDIQQQSCGSWCSLKRNIASHSGAFLQFHRLSLRPPKSHPVLVSKLQYQLPVFAGDAEFLELQSTGNEQLLDVTNF